MGGANNICSDKTGTLTQNEMNVVNIYQGVNVKLKSQDQYNLAEIIPNPAVAQIFLQATSCNTLGTEKDTNATDKSILKLYRKLGYSLNEFRDKHLPEGFTRFQFTSKRKKMSTILENVDDTESGYGKRLMTKGGAEGILELCTHYLNESGDKEDITPQKKKDIEQWIQRYAEDALRCIGLAYKDLNPHEGGQDHDEMSVDKVNRVVEKGGFTLICVLGIRDILRDHVKEAVKTCQSAQVAVRMVTGDNKITATAIAKDCGILPENYKPHPEYGMYEVTTGPEFAQRVGGIQNPGAGEAEVVSNKEEFAMYRKHLKVLARSRPDDKYLLVTGLKQFEDVVAVTGDGTNDAPALKKADVGFAMGIAGTDVAKHACDIIIMDDSFASIVVACKWGRNIYDNIRRFLQFQLTVNLCALVSAFIGSCIL